jgi:hypothetical protein
LSARFDFAVAAEEFVALVVGEAGPGLLASGVDQALNHGRTGVHHTGELTRDYQSRGVKCGNPLENQPQISNGRRRHL